MLRDVLGNPVRPAGRFLFHEHVQFGWPGAERDPMVSRPSEDVSREIGVLQELAAAGFSCFVDATPLECQRDLTRLAAIAAAVPVQIVAATGLYHAKSGYPTHFATLSPDELAELYVRDLNGENTESVPAGIIKVATGRPPFAKRERNALMAAAKAALETGVRIVSHAESLEAAQAQLEIFTAAALPPARVVLGHLDAESARADEVAKLAMSGAFIGVDRCGHDTFALPEDRLSLLAQLRSAGVLANVLLSHDAVLSFVGRRAVAAGNPFLRIADELLPSLAEHGFSADECEQLVAHNVHRFFGLSGEAHE